MAESTLSIAYADLVADLERYYGIATGTETALIDRRLRDGMRRFYMAHDWKFLRPRATLSTVAPYTTGTVAATSGVVTLTTGTFPSWAASAVLIVDNISYKVSTRDSSTQVTLEDVSVDIDSGSTYELVQLYYDLPDAFAGELLGPLTYHPGLNEQYIAIEIVDERLLRIARQQVDDTAAPWRAAILPKTFDPTVGERWQITFFPLPDEVYQFTYRYRVHPDKLTTTNKYAWGGMIHGETIRLAVLAAAELDRNDFAGPYAQQYELALQRSIMRDNDNSPDSMGLILDPGEGLVDDADWSRIDRGSPYPPYTD
jgi:hypothetical protein